MLAKSMLVLSLVYHKRQIDVLAPPAAVGKGLIGDTPNPGKVLSCRVPQTLYPLHSQSEDYCCNKYRFRLCSGGILAHVNLRTGHPVTNDKKAVPLVDNGQEPDSTISRWRWRPGMKPRFALTIGALFGVVGLLFFVIGLVSLIAGIQDSNSAPVQVPGIVTRYTTNYLDSLPHVIIRVEKANSTTTISPAVTQVTARSLHIGDHVIVDYSQRLHFPYALES